MEAADELEPGTASSAKMGAGQAIQSAGYLLELSLDWIILRASENIDRLIGESHVTLIDEPLGRFVHAQALHDLRNLFSRLSGTTGIARAYRVRLTDDPDLVDVAFQLIDGRVLFEAVPAAHSFGDHFGTVGGLIAGLANSGGQDLLDNGARRMRALTGYDRVRLICGEQRADSSRGAFAAAAVMEEDLPAIVVDAAAEPVALFPRDCDESSASEALMHACDPADRNALEKAGVRACLTIPFLADGISGEFRCESRTPREPSFELHAAGELFGQLFAMRCAIDQLRQR